MFGAVFTNIRDMPVYSDEFTKAHPEDEGDSPTGKLTVYENRGGVLFEKQYPEGTYINETLISDNGNVAVLAGSPDAYAVFKLYVYDRSGREILVYPKGNKYGFFSDPVFSPNGKYLALRNGNAVFFNTSTGAHWRAGERYRIREISNSGIARVGVTETIDLKEHLGE
jgi:hypothetical protein